MQKNKKSHKEEQQTKQKNPHKREKHKTNSWPCVFNVFVNCTDKNKMFVITRKIFYHVFHIKTYGKEISFEQSSKG